MPTVSTDRSQTTLAEFGELWLGLQAADLAPATVASYRAVWSAHIAPALGGLSLASLIDEPLVVAQFKAGLLGAGRGEPVVRRTLVVLGAVLQRALDWRYVEGTNPVRLTRVPAGRPRRFVEPLAPAEVERLRAACRDTRDATLISVLAYAGVRPGEALALRWRCVRDDALLVERAVSMGRSERPRPAGCGSSRWLLHCVGILRRGVAAAGRAVRAILSLGLTPAASGPTRRFATGAVAVSTLPATPQWSCRSRRFSTARCPARRRMRCATLPPRYGSGIRALAGRGG